MSAFAHHKLTPFAHDISTGMMAANKHIPLCELFDEVGELLFKAVESLPDYGLARAEHRILERYKADIAYQLDPKLMRPKILRIDLTAGSGLQCTAKGWLERAQRRVSKRAGIQPLLLSLPRGFVGTLDRCDRNSFLAELRGLLQPGDFFLFGADLAKDTARTLSAYNDTAGVVAAFNKNVLIRVNRELGGHFDVTRFEHHAKWDAFLRRIELHLVALSEHDVYIAALGQRFHFETGDTIRTGAFYKSSELELEALATSMGFVQLKSWIDLEWSFEEVLWRA